MSVFHRMTTIGQAQAMAYIWPEPFSSQFFGACKGWMGSDEPGEILLYTNPKLCMLPIGVTGWYPVSAGCAFLRWHGICDMKRGRGQSRKMFEMLTYRLRTYYGIHTLYELSETENARDYFIKNHGFKLADDEDLKASLRREAGDFKYVLELEI